MYMLEPVDIKLVIVEENYSGDHQMHNNWTSHLHACLACCLLKHKIMHVPQREGIKIYRSLQNVDVNSSCIMLDLIVLTAEKQREWHLKLIQTGNVRLCLFERIIQDANYMWIRLCRCCFVNASCAHQYIYFFFPFVFYKQFKKCHCRLSVNFSYWLYCVRFTKPPVFKSLNVIQFCFLPNPLQSTNYFIVVNV